MTDITQKISSLRTASARGVVACSAETLLEIEKNALPKGNLFDVARAAGLLGAKNTDRLIPHCHPVRIDSLDITFSLTDKGIVIEAVAQSIDKTGIEMEVLTAVSVTALTIYDLLKPLDKNLSITDIKLTGKTGGKKYYKNDQNFRASILVVSDSIFLGQGKDKSGSLIAQILQTYHVPVTETVIVPDSMEEIQKSIKNNNSDIYFITGGTGVSPRDITFESIYPLIEKRLPGVEEAMRSFGQSRNQRAMLSRSLVGFMGKTLVICLPGSSSGVRESLLAILPELFHAIDIHRGNTHHT